MYLHYTPKSLRDEEKLQVLLGGWRRWLRVSGRSPVDLQPGLSASTPVFSPFALTEEDPQHRAVA